MYIPKLCWFPCLPDYLIICLLQVHIVQTTEDSTFGFIKYKFLQQLVKFPAIQIRIIFYGSIVKDDETPIDIDCGSVRASPNWIYFVFTLVHVI